MPFKFITWAKKAQDILGYDYQKGTPPEAMSKIVESKNITLTFDRDGNSFPTMSYNGGYYSILFEEKNGSTLEVSGKQKVLVDVSGSDLWLEYYGEVGVDIVKAGSHSATIEGRGGNDELTGGRAEDYLSGGIGNDEVSGGGGNDFLHGDNGDDRLAGAGAATSFQVATARIASTEKAVATSFSATRAMTR
jgi:Ca2+-binding RTX toxin-like protein